MTSFFCPELCFPGQLVRRGDSPHRARGFGFPASAKPQSLFVERAREDRILTGANLSVMGRKNCEILGRRRWSIQEYVKKK